MRETSSFKKAATWGQRKERYRAIDRMVKSRLRVLLFAKPEFASDADTLSQFALVRQVQWRYRPIQDTTRYLWIRIPYRTVEGLYWIFRLLIEIQRFQANVIVARYAYFCGLIGAIAAGLSRKKFVIRVVGSDLKVHSRSLFGRMTVLLIFRIASGAVCTSGDLERMARAFGARSTKVIPSALNLPGSMETSAPEKDRVVITVTRLVPVKGISYLIRAMTYIKEGTLLIIGDGPERTRLELLSQELGLASRVLFAGRVDDRSKLSYHLKRAMVFVLPSLSEGTPRAVIEAMSCGLPIVATKVGGIPEIITDGVNGFLVPIRNEKALAEAIEKALWDTDFQRKASAKNREVVKRFLVPTAARNTHNYFREISVQR